MSVTLAFMQGDTPYPWPTADQAAHAARFAAERAEYRIAQQLMGLACALKDREDTEAMTSFTNALAEPQQPRTPLRVAPYVAGPTGDGNADLAAAQAAAVPAPDATAEMAAPVERTALSVVYNCPYCLVPVRQPEYESHRSVIHGLTQT